MSAAKLYNELKDIVAVMDRYQIRTIDSTPLISVMTKVHQVFSCGACGWLALDAYQKTSIDCFHTICRTCIGLLITTCDSCTPDGGCYTSDVELRSLIEDYKRLCKVLWSSGFFRNTLITNYVNYKPFIDMVAEGADFPHRSSKALSFSAEEYSSFHPIEHSSPDYLELLLENVLMLAKKTSFSYYDLPSCISDPEVFVRNPASSNLKVLQNSSNKYKDKRLSASKKLRKNPLKRKQRVPDTKALDTFAGNQGTAGKEAAESKTQCNRPSCSSSKKHMDAVESSSTLTMKKKELLPPKLNYYLPGAVVECHSQEVNLGDHNYCRSEMCTSSKG